MWPLCGFSWIATILPVVGRRVRRVPGRAAADEQHEVGVLERLVGVEAEIERVVGREIGEDW